MSETSVAGSQLSDEEMTALVLAVQLLITSSASPSVRVSAIDTPVWRFSGRRFSNQRRFD